MALASLDSGADSRMDQPPSVPIGHIWYILAFLYQHLEAQPAFFRQNRDTDPLTWVGIVRQSSSLSLLKTATRILPSLPQFLRIYKLLRGLGGGMGRRFPGNEAASVPGRLRNWPKFKLFLSIKNLIPKSSSEVSAAVPSEISIIFWKAYF